MGTFGTILSIVGGVSLFLYGMNVMSDGIQRGAGDKLKKAFNFMTINRFAGVMTGLTITGIIQSSQAVTVMLVSFVNAGLLTLNQSIGVIMGANIGTTVTAWIVSLVGFSLNLSALALPAIGIGFISTILKWKYRNLGEIILGFGLLFLGLDFMTKSMPNIGNSFNVITAVSNMGFLSNLIGMFAGLVMTLIIHSSSASTAIMLTMTYNGLIGYEMAAAMILGANIGTTVDAALAAIGTKTAARQTALVHVLFNVIGTCWAIPLLKPLLGIVEMVTPGTITGLSGDPSVTTHLAMLHTVFNVLNTLIFLPFVSPFARFVSWVIKDKGDGAETPQHYRLAYKSGSLGHNTPELEILRVEREIRSLAGLASDMYNRFCAALESTLEAPLLEETAKKLIEKLKEQENYADEMQEALTAFLLECSKEHLNRRTERRVSRLLRIIADLEDMTDNCFGLGLILERSVVKNQIFNAKEVKALIPYTGLVTEFLKFLEANLEGALSADQTAWALEMEIKIDASRDKLRKFGRKRIEAGKDVRTELLFIDVIKRIEKMGDYCYNISGALAK